MRGMWVFGIILNLGLALGNCVLAISAIMKGRIVAGSFSFVATVFLCGVAVLCVYEMTKDD